MVAAYGFSSCPMGPIFAIPILGWLLAIGGVAFSVFMLIDCLKRKPGEFFNPLAQNGEYDRLIWAGAIVASVWFCFIGAIAYLFVVKMAKGESDETEE